MLFLAGCKILCGDVYDAVRIDIERNLDLRDAARCGRDAVQLEQAELLVVAGKFTFALQDVDLNLRSGRPQPWRRSGSSWSGWWCCAR